MRIELKDLKLYFFISRKILRGDSESNRLSKPVISIATGGIIVGIMAMMITVFIVKGFQKEVRERAVAFGGHIQVIKNSTNNSAETLPIYEGNKTCQNLAEFENVKHIQHYISKNGIIKTKTENEGILVKGVSENYDWGFIGSHIVEGRVIKPEKDTSENFALISKTTADRLQLQCNESLFVYFILTDSLVKIKLETGDTLVATNSDLLNKISLMSIPEKPDTSLVLKFNSKVKKFRILGIYETGMEEFDKRIVFTTERSIEKICNWRKDQTGAFEIILNDFEKLDETAESIGEFISGDIDLNSMSIKDTNPGIFEWLDMHDTTAWIIIALMIVVAVINMISALIILIIEKINLIGLLKALGMKTKKIISVFLYQAAIIISKGLLIGNILGIGLAFFQYKTHFFELDQSTYYMPFIPIKFEWTYLLLLNLGTFATCIIFMLLPCLIIARTSPIRSIRFN